MVVASQSHASERIDVDLSTTSGATYTGDFTPAGLDETGTERVFESSVVSLRMAKAGGLNATYHRGVDLAFPVAERVDAMVDFSCTQASPEPRNPKLETRCLKPETRNPKPEIPKPES